ncbi:hypothetical protein GCM10010156_09960 [Planobispora rosea]|uniref:Uncharacterized protein n=1 Tax=Planobispora rosea TaxID=35762 RepID=A0A8J3RVK4_PLARO|nr:hypothetical protein GCM10010156_09960 [Planobispora rosea]GIH82597.1 hypothetical protein Pro02_10050 [Planobispora rosea]
MGDEAVEEPVAEAFDAFKQLALLSLGFEPVESSDVLREPARRGAGRRPVGETNAGWRRLGDQHALPHGEQPPYWVPLVQTR